MVALYGSNADWPIWLVFYVLGSVGLICVIFWRVDPREMKTHLEGCPSIIACPILFPSTKLRFPSFFLAPSPSHCCGKTGACLPTGAIWWHRSISMTQFLLLLQPNSTVTEAHWNSLVDKFIQYTWDILGIVDAVCNWDIFAYIAWWGIDFHRYVFSIDRKIHI